MGIGGERWQWIGMGDVSRMGAELRRVVWDIFIREHWLTGGCVRLDADTWLGHHSLRSRIR